jgi:hypothetical protein
MANKEWKPIQRQPDWTVRHRPHDPPQVVVQLSDPPPADWRFPLTSTTTTLHLVGSEIQFDAGSVEDRDAALADIDRNIDLANDDYERGRLPKLLEREDLAADARDERHTLLRELRELNSD